MDRVGTGFLAGPDAIITNRRVAEVSASLGPDGWRFRPGMSPNLDFNRGHGAVEPLSFALADGVGGALSTPLSVAAAAPGTVVDRTV